MLRDALASLISEKPYDSIAIKEILQRANVGRSTFYMHFRDKDDLLVSGIYGMVESVATAKLRRSTIWHERILWFSLPIFEYHWNHRHNGRFTLGDRGTAIQHVRLQQILSEMITDAVRAELTRARPKTLVPLDLAVQYISSTFVLVLEWWLGTANPLPPNDIVELYRALVLPTLGAVRS